MTLHDKHIKQIEKITESLAAVCRQVNVLGDMQGLDGDQNATVAMLRQGLDGIRGWELGICRQSFGLDQYLVYLTRNIKEGKTHGN